MKQKPYPAYKHSGVEWLGAVPEHWVVKSLRYLTNCLDGKRIPLNSEQRGEMQGDYPYWGANGIVDYVNDYLFDDKVILLGEDGAPFLEKNKIVAFAVTGKIWVNNHAHILKAIKCNNKFLAACLNITEYGAFIDGSTRDKLTQSDMNSIPIPVPSLPEQKAIAAFLDCETGRIDALVTKKERLIELLWEKRSALISHAVTKGLDPSVKLKPSGVEWLGDVPEHWEVKKLKWFYNRINSGDGISPDSIEPEGTYPVYGGNGIMGYTENFNSDYDDIIIGRVGAKCGNVYHVPGRKWISDNALNLSISNCDKYYLLYFLDARNLNQLSNQNAQPLITGSMVGNQYVALPALPEQQAIAAFLDRETGNIDALMAKVEAAITKLKEYRTALISAAVTGKIDVREAA